MNEEKPSKKEEELNKKEAGIVGVIVVSAIFTLVVLIMFAWPPISFLYSKWNDYWDEPKVSSSFTTKYEDNEDDRKRREAYDDCENKAKKYFDSLEVASYASTTNKYETYTCYGVNWEKIPNE